MGNELSRFDFIGTNAAATLLGCTPKTVRNMILDGRLAAEKLPNGHSAILVSSIERMISEGKGHAEVADLEQRIIRLRSEAKRHPERRDHLLAVQALLYRVLQSFGNYKPSVRVRHAIAMQQEHPAP